MENKVGADFGNLAQRVAYSYMATFPEFSPVDSNEASKQSQRDLYGFLKGIVGKLYKDPSLLSLPVQKDEYFNAWELQKHKPKLILDMKNIRKKIDDFYVILIRIGELGILQGDELYLEKDRMKLSSIFLKRLEGFGLSCVTAKEGVNFRCEGFPALFPAWKLLAAIAGRQPNPVTFFSRCMPDTSHSYADQAFEALAGDKAAYALLRDFFEQNGYRRVDCRENEFSLDWVKNHGKKEEPLKASWAEREHSGLSIWFDLPKKYQVHYGLRVPRYKELLSHFDELDDRLKSFVISKTKKCDSCGYCTQTDKTGTRSRQCITVRHNGEYQLCMLYPGFSYIWAHMDVATAEDIIAFLKWIDRLLSK